MAKFISHQHGVANRPKATVNRGDDLNFHVRKMPTRFRGGVSAVKFVQSIIGTLVKCGPCSAFDNRKLYLRTDQAIQIVNEMGNFLSSILGRILKPAVDRVLGNYVDELYNDPELQASMKDLEKQRKRVDKLTDDYCKKNPDSIVCREWRQGKR